MPVSFQPQTFARQNFTHKTRENLKSLSISKKQRQKTPSNQRSAARLPSIGIMFSNNLSLGNKQNQQIHASKKRTPLKLGKEERINRIQNVKSKIQLNHKSKKVVLDKRPKLMSVSTHYKKQKQQTYEELTPNQTSILDLPFTTTKLGTNLKNISTEKFFQFIQSKQNYVKVTRSEDIAVQTDNCQMSNHSYEQFIKFRITERQKYQKLKNLFRYVQSLTHIESENFKSNAKEFSTLIESNDQAYKDKQVKNLLSDYESKFLNFNEIFKDTFTDQRDNIKDFQKAHTDYHCANKKLFKELQQKISNFCILNEPGKILNYLQQIFQQTLMKHENFMRESNQIFTQKMEAFYKTYKQLEEKYFQWNKTTFDQSKLIKNCVMSIMQLPGLLIGLFGSGKSEENSDSNDESKAYVNSDKIATNIIDFFVKRRRPEPKEINEVFLKFSEVKCMNCVYMKTKMRFIHEKNKELKPIVKMLMNLVDNNAVQSQLIKNSTQRNLNSTARKLHA